MRRFQSSPTFVVGSTGCNGLVADYVQRAAVLSFAELEITDAPCTPAAQKQQAAMMSVLDATVLLIDLPPDRLALTSGESGERLEFVSSTPLEGSTWLLVRIPGKPDPEGVVTLRLFDGRLSGEGPCGPYSGRYQTNGLLISISDVSGSDVADCDQVRRERQLLSALRRAVLVDKSTASLRLIDTFGRTVARFRHPRGP